MKHKIFIQAGCSEGLIERILCRIRSRGWELTALSAEKDPSVETLSIRLTIEGVRQIECLIRQLEKLHDVQIVSNLDSQFATKLIRTNYELKAPPTARRSPAKSGILVRYDSEGWDSEERLERNSRGQA